MKKAICILIALTLFLTGCSSLFGSTTTSSSVYDQKEIPNLSKKAENETEDEYPLIEYSQTVSGELEKDDKFSVIATFDDSEIRIYDTNEKVHYATAKVDDDPILFLFQTGSFSSDEEADLFDFGELDSLAGKQGVFKFTYIGFYTPQRPLALLNEVEVDGKTYTIKDIGNIEKQHKFSMFK